jgi:CHAT domain-containing protein
LAALAIRDAAIPQAEVEAHAAGRHFAQSSIYLEASAGLEGLTNAAAEADVLHIATHGLFRPDNPFFSALKLADGWIDVRQIYRLSLRAQLVVLSACESGAVQVQGGDEAIGLARGFLGAGASSVVASLWNVHDESAGELMDCFYSEFTAAESVNPYEAASALRKAQCVAASSGKHPYYWASYVAIGG